MKKYISRSPLHQIKKEKMCHLGLLAELKFKKQCFLSSTDSSSSSSSDPIDFIPQHIANQSSDEGVSEIDSDDNDSFCDKGYTILGHRFEHERSMFLIEPCNPYKRRIWISYSVLTHMLRKLAESCSIELYGRKSKQGSERSA